MLCFVLFGGANERSHASGGGIIDPRGWNYYPLEFGHLVVTGIVTQVDEDSVRDRDLYGLPDDAQMTEMDTRVKRLHVTVREVMRGSVVRREK